MVIDPCEKCGSGRVAAVLDLRMARSPKSGNQYRRRCLECGKWLTFCSAADWQNAERQRVLPADQDPEADDPTIPVEEADLSDFEIPGIDQRLVADGGSDDVGEPDPELEDDSDGVGEEPDNEFDCPGCGEHVLGFPEECPNCGAPYDWGDEIAEEDL